MPKHKIDGLFTKLHEKFANSDTSPAQEALLLQLQSQLADWDGPRQLMATWLPPPKCCWKPWRKNTHSYRE